MKNMIARERRGFLKGFWEERKGDFLRGVQRKRMVFGDGF